MNSKRVAIFAMVTLSATLQVSAERISETGIVDGKAKNFLRKSVGEIITTTPNFEALTAALVATGLVTALPPSDPYTVMAPINEAFCRLGDLLGVAGCENPIADCTSACWDPLIAATSGEDGPLANILLAHVITSKVSLRQLKRANRKPIVTLGTYVPTGELFFFESQIVNSNTSVLCRILEIFNCFPLYEEEAGGRNNAYVREEVRASNGVIWAIDSILDPITDQ